MGELLERSVKYRDPEKSRSCCVLSLDHNCLGWGSSHPFLFEVSWVNQRKQKQPPPTHTNPGSLSWCETKLEGELGDWMGAFPGLWW